LPLESKLMFRDLKTFLVIETSIFMANETESCQPDMPIRYGFVIGSSKTKPNRQ